jgi:hypothetical protein
MDKVRLRAELQKQIYTSKTLKVYLFVYMPPTYIFREENYMHSMHT